MTEYAPVIGSAVTALAVIVSATLGLLSYRRQKNLDRKQESYQGYLSAFQEANFWSGLDKIKHNEAHARYQTVRERLLLVASKEVFDAANGFHNCYVDNRSLQDKAKELEHKYAAMIAAMRRDGFDRAITTPEEVKKRIPWEI